MEIYTRLAARDAKDQLVFGTGIVHLLKKVFLTQRRKALPRLEDSFLFAFARETLSSSSRPRTSFAATTTQRTNHFVPATGDDSRIQLFAHDPSRVSHQRASPS